MTLSTPIAGAELIKMLHKRFFSRRNIGCNHSPVADHKHYGTWDDTHNRWIEDGILESYSYSKNKLIRSLYQNLLYLHIATGSLSPITEDST